jgi:HD domain
MSVPRTYADEVVSTPAEKAALEALRRVAGVRDTPMERHCLRVFLIIERLATERSIAIDRELALCVSLLFDIGVYPAVATRDVYTRDGRRFARQVLAPFSWPEARLHRALEAIERHHQVRAQWQHGAEVELLRLADLVDVLPAVFRFGLPGAWLDELARRLPRDGLFSSFLGPAVGAMLRQRPGTIPRIFLPPRPMPAALSDTAGP